MKRLPRPAAVGLAVVLATPRPGTGTPGSPPAACTSTAPNGVRNNDANAYSATLTVPTP